MNESTFVSIDGYSSEGAGVGRLPDGQVVFVRSGARGDLCALRVTGRRGGALLAEIAELVTPSDARIEPPCPYFGVCGGCDFQHVTYDEELSLKRQRVDDALGHIAGLSLKTEKIVPAQKTSEYRNKALFALQRKNDNMVFGYRQARSHELVPIDTCLLQHGNALVTARTAVALGIPGEALEVRTNTSGRSHVCIHADTRDPASLRPFARALAERCPFVDGVALRLPSRSHALYGVGYLTEHLCGMNFRLSPESFFQVNTPQAELLYALALEFAAPFGGGYAADLYCGVGATTLAFARTFKRITGVEISREAVREARRSAVANDVDNAEFVCADAAAWLGSLPDGTERPGVVFLDPPRRGVDRALIERTSALSPSIIIYISCDPATLARDIKLFGAYGYRAVRCAAVDMFPRTANVECVAALVRE